MTSSSASAPLQSCNGCGGNKHEDRSQCPAQGKECGSCHKLHHLAKVCRSSNRQQHPSGATVKRDDKYYRNNGNTVKSVNFNSSSRDEKHPRSFTSSARVNQVSSAADTHLVNTEQFEAFTRYQQMVDTEFAAIHVSSRQLYNGPRVTIDMCGSQVEFLIDTGAPVNVIDERMFGELACKPDLRPCKVEFFGFGSAQPLDIVGQFSTEIAFNGQSLKVGFLVKRGESERLLCFTTSTLLGIIRVFNNVAPAVTQPSASPATSSSSTTSSMLCPPQAATGAKPPLAASARLTTSELKARFPRTFSGRLGCIQDHRVGLEIDPAVRPVAQRLRPIAFHLRDVVGRELDAQVKDGILEKVDKSMGHHGSATWSWFPKARSAPVSLSCLSTTS